MFAEPNLCQMSGKAGSGELEFYVESTIRIWVFLLYNYCPFLFDRFWQEREDRPSPDGGRTGAYVVCPA